MKLYPYQEKVLEVTEKYNHVAYYLDMGLGKTFVGSEKLWELNNDVNLVVCQKSKVDDWVAHFREHYPEYSTIDLTSNKKEDKRQRNGAFVNIRLGSCVPVVLVINYDLIFRREELKYLDNVDYTLLLDESSLISNENAKRSKAVLKMDPESVILLSGTPVAGKYEKLWSQCRLLGWEISKKKFWDTYVISKYIDIGFPKEVAAGYKNVEDLKGRLSGYGAVFMKADEVTGLPEQVRQDIRIRASPDYKRFIKDGYIKLKDGTELIGDNPLTKMLYARQLCGQYHKEKIKAFKDLIDSTGDRVIVFYNFNAELELLKEAADGRPISEVNGRRKNLEAYENSDGSVTFVQYQAGAMGLNLQKANKIIYFTLPLGKGSCDLWEQSKKRIHRIGQERTCFYYYLLVSDSIEIRNLKALEEGRDLTDELFRRAYGT